MNTSSNYTVLQAEMYEHHVRIMIFCLPAIDTLERHPCAVYESVDSRMPWKPEPSQEATKCRSVIQMCIHISQTGYNPILRY